MSSRYALALASVGGYSGVSRFLWKNRRYIKKGYSYYKKYNKRKMYMRFKRRGRKYSNKKRRIQGPGARVLCRRNGDVFPAGTQYATLGVGHNLGAASGGTAFIRLQKLHTNQLPWPEIASNVGDLNGRNGTQIFVKGIKICRNIQALHKSDTGGPYIFHWALVQLNMALNDLKTSAGVDIDEATVHVPLEEEFFRDHAGGTNRWTSFVESSAATDNWQAVQACGQMNPHHIFKVLSHKKKRMLGNATAAYGNIKNSNETKTIWHIDQYIKVNKSFHFHSASGGTGNRYPNRPIMEVLWVTPLGPEGIPVVGDGGITKDNAFGTWHQNTVYYTNINKGG